MAWETHGSNRYYYRKQREGKRVISQYIGRGALAEAAANLDALDRQRQVIEREAWKETKQYHLEIDAMIDEFAGYVKAMTKAELLLAGCYTHKRQWRKRSDRSQSTYE